MLKPIGIKKGNAFTPDARQKKIFTDAAEVGFLMAQTLSAALEHASSYPGTRSWAAARDLRTPYRRKCAAPLQPRRT
jgi:hypothetical protein